ncbi:MAG: hypothetical protein JWN80_2620 [Microbacteriaceae bacterium]|nr:hypothetical protein [Microbacteriaceae bacterium]
MRLIGVLETAVLVAACLLLAGCASAQPPVSAAQRAQIRTALLDKQWQEIANVYPDAIRPKAPATHTVPDHDWPQDVVDCLHDRGYIAQVSGDSFTFDSFSNQTNVDFHVEGYLCTSAYVQQSDVLARLTKQQQQAFDDFEVYQVQPCLRLAGAQTFPPPVGHLTGLSSWSPFDLVWLTGSTKSSAYLEQKCPPTPSWLDLADAG